MNNDVERVEENKSNPISSSITLLRVANQKPRKWAGQEVEEQPADKGLERGLLVVTGVPEAQGGEKEKHVPGRRPQRLAEQQRLAEKQPNCQHQPENHLGGLEIFQAKERCSRKRA